MDMRNNPSRTSKLKLKLESWKVMEQKKGKKRYVKSACLLIMNVSHLQYLNITTLPSMSAITKPSAFVT